VVAERQEKASVRKKALALFLFFFEKIINFPANVIGQTAETRSLGCGQFSVADFVLEDFLHFFPDPVKQDVIDHQASP
jgi:hypothetical protein